MMRGAGRWVIGVVLTLLAGVTPAAEPAAPWPQSQSDLAPDPAVRFGSLANGFRYALMRNQTPKGQVSLRLRIDAGAVEEDENQQGLAHFIEHLAFRGSTHVPDHEVFQILERFGAALGADTNAFTDQTQTVYKFDLPHNTPEAMDTALRLMRDIASDLSFAEAAVNSERAVVLSEERAGDTPGARLNKAEMAFVFKDQPIGNRLPIGSVDVLKQAGSADLRRFYDAYYRPERATLIVVGDFVPARLEARIKEAFGSWRGRGKPGTVPKLGPPLRRGPEQLVMQQAGAPTVATMEWTQASDPRPDNAARRRDRLLVNLALDGFNQRLQDLAHGDHPPFLGAASFFRPIGASGALTAIGVGTGEDDWRRGIVAAMSAQRGLVSQGLRQDELDRQIAELQSALNSAVVAAASRKTVALATELLQSVDQDTVFTTPRSALARFDAARASLSLDAVNQAAKRAFSGNGPLIFLAGPQPILGLDALLQDVDQIAPDIAAAPPPAVWPYRDFGAAGRVVERSEIPDLGVTLLRFANGVRLTVKPTRFRGDQILLRAALGHGRQDLPIDQPNPLWAAEAFIDGGLQALALPDIDRLMAGKQVHVQFGVSDNGFTLSGATRPTDLDATLQVMTAYLTAPGWRPEALEAVRNRLIAALPQWKASPIGVFHRQAAWLLHDGDPRWQPPDGDRLRTTSLGDLRTLLDPVLAHAPIELVIVGDITVDTAIAAVSATLGALPERAPETAPPAAGRQARFPGATEHPMTIHHSGRNDQGLAAAAWPTTDSIDDPFVARKLRLLQLVFQQRLFDEFRTRLGDSYSPSSDIASSTDFSGYGYVLAIAETPENRMPDFDETVAKITADLRDGEVSADEFERARKPRIEELLRAQQTNEWWATLLQRAASDAKMVAVIRTVISDMQRATPADIRETAQTYLRSDTLWRLRITPETTSLGAR